MSDHLFQNQVVLITGAASGFGAMAATRFARDGAKLALCDVDADGLESISRQITSIGAQVFHQTIDISDADQVAGFHDAVVAEFGRIDVAINNAGVVHEFQPLTALSVEEFDRVFAINTRGTFLCMKSQIPVMAAQACGVILNVASVAGLVGAGQLAGYAASKHAVVGLTRSAADECAGQGIRINALCPSFAQTPLYEDIAARLADHRGGDVARVEQRITKRSPMGRLARAEEVVDAMRWLCSPQNSFMTGQAIALDGGLTAI